MATAGENGHRRKGQDEPVVFQFSGSPTSAGMGMAGAPPGTMPPAAGQAAGVDLTAPPVVASGPGASSSSPGSATSLAYNNSSAPESGAPLPRYVRALRRPASQLRLLSRSTGPLRHVGHCQWRQLLHPDQALAANPTGVPIMTWVNGFKTDNGYFWRSIIAGAISRFTTALGPGPQSGLLWAPITPGAGMGLLAR